MSSFVHLHCHTEYSLLDGAIRLKDLCARTREFGMPAAAVTDHGNLFAAAYFYSMCKDYGVHPVIGCEVYVAPDRLDKTSDLARVRHHLILLAKNNEGYHNLVKLVSRSWLEGFHYRPRVDKSLLRQFSSGIIALSACVAGEIPRTLMGKNRQIPSGGTYEDAVHLAGEYSDIFRDGFYLEIQANSLPEQSRVNSGLRQLALETGLPLVATNDCHYLNSDDVEAHDVLLCIQTQAHYEDTDRFRFAADDLYFKSPQEMAEAFADCPEAIENSVKIAEQCDVTMDFGKHFFPVYELSEGMTLETEFQRLAREGLERRLKEHPDRDHINQQAYWDRLEMELDVICKMGFPGYFLIVQDFINWAKSHDIPVGPGRGSAAGSVVVWSLRITNLDPLPYNLIFERFLNIERVSLPDIDVDFCEQNRTKVIQYVTQKYGADSVAQITTFGKMKAKAVVRDVGRVFNMPLKDVDRIAKMIPEDLKITISKALDAEPELMKLYKSDPDIRRLIDISMRLEGLSRHASTHAAGVVISDKPMENYLPLYRGKKNELVTQFDMKMVEKVGLVKFDFLGLRTMTIIDRTLKTIAEQEKIPPNLDTLPLSDPQVFDLFSKGDTDGVFQVESSGMRQYLRMLRPTCFEDLIAMLALYRPGPLGSGMVDEFIKRKHGEVAVTYPLPSLEQCLKDTYGVIVYQEQVMQITQIVAGYTLGGADLLRRAMGKKNAEAMAEQRGRFVSGAIERGTSEEKASEIFDLMEKFAEYGFNKSHSAAYAQITYHTAYLKTYYPVEFMASVLTSEIGNQDHILKYINVCSGMGVQILPPDVQLSRSRFSVHDGKIVFGLAGIRNIGAEVVQEIERAREQDGPFQSLSDLCLRTNPRRITRRTLENLIKSGACDCFGEPRARMLQALDNIISRSQKKSREQNSNQISLFGLLPQQPVKEEKGLGIDFPEVEEWSNEEKLRFEKETLGFYLSSHPLKPYVRELRRLGLQTLEDVRELSHQTSVQCAVLITSVREITTKTGKRMAFAAVEDLTGTAEVTFFAEELSASRELISSEQPVVLSATVDRSRDEKQDSDIEEDSAPRVIRLLGTKLTLLKEMSQSNHASPQDFPIAATQLDDTAIRELKALLSQHKGDTVFQLDISFPDGVICRVEFGQDWKVNPGQDLLRDLERWAAR